MGTIMHLKICKTLFYTNVAESNITDLSEITLSIDSNKKDEIYFPLNKNWNSTNKDYNYDNSTTNFVYTNVNSNANSDNSILNLTSFNTCEYTETDCLEVESEQLDDNINFKDLVGKLKHYSKLKI